ncbi:MAG: hypothetical protein ACKO37_10290 [Vampirovibrionales bacterium]
MAFGLQQFKKWKPKFSTLVQQVKKIGTSSEVTRAKKVVTQAKTGFPIPKTFKGKLLLGAGGVGALGVGAVVIGAKALGIHDLKTAKAVGESLYLTYQADQEFKQYGETFPEDKKVIANRAMNSKRLPNDKVEAGYSPYKPSVIFVDPDVSKIATQRMQKYYPKLKPSLYRVSTLKHELRHAAVQDVLTQKGYSLQESQELYTKHQCLQEVDAEKVAYQFIVKHDPGFKQKFPSVSHFSGYSQDCKQEFALNESTGNKPQTPQQVVESMEQRDRLEARKKHANPKPK